MSSFNYKGRLSITMNMCEAFGSINNIIIIIIIIIIIHLYSAIFNTMCRSRALNISYAQDKTLKYYRIKIMD